MIFDSHAHYDDEAFDADREALLDSFPANGIGCVVNAGASFASNKKTMELISRYPFLYAAVGIHPEHADALDDKGLEWLREQFSNPKVVAVGEIGLDYYWDGPDREIQKKAFISQLALAREVKRPVVIHSRDACLDTLDIMREEYGKGEPAVIHCFSYSREAARDFLNLGCMIGIGGVVTFQNARKTVEVVTELPLNRLLLETDAHYLSPVPMRGQRCRSDYISFTAERIAEIKGISPKEGLEASRANIHTLFGI